MGTRLRYLRDTAGLTTREVDAAASLNGGHSTQIENGQLGSRISGETLLAIAKVFGVEPEWLLHGTGTPPVEADVVAAARKSAPTARVFVGEPPASGASLPDVDDELKSSA